MRTVLAFSILLLLPVDLLAQDYQPAATTTADAETLIAEAMLAAPPSITEDATFMDWEENVLREGTNGWTCMPSPPGFRSTPMCLDQAWLTWAHAWQTRTAVSIDDVGVGYMLAGDAGASNIDPWATQETPDNEWVVSGPHLMIIAPDTDHLAGLPTDPENGGPWVMWQGTPYAHIMIPVGDRPTR